MSQLPQSRNELQELNAKATPGPWKADPKRLIVNNMMGPIMCYLAGHADAEEGMKVSLGSERIADHHFVAALVNAYRAGELVHRATVSETAFIPEVKEALEYYSHRDRWIVESDQKWSTIRDGAPWEHAKLALDALDRATRTERG